MEEEQFISKLHFSWPQVSCAAQFPPRGSRVVFASYRDCAGQKYMTDSSFHDMLSNVEKVITELGGDLAV